MKRTILAAAAVCLGVFSVQATAAPIPAEEFGRMPMFSDIRISPDGTKFSALVRPTNQDEYVFVVYENNPDDLKLLFAAKQDEKFRVRSPFWVNDRYIMFGVSFADQRYGTDTVETRLMALDTTNNKIEWMFKGSDFRDNPPQIQDNIVSMNWDDPNTIYVQYWMASGYGVFKVAAEGKNRHPTVERARTDIMDWSADNRGVVRSGWGIENDKREKLIVKHPDDSWKNISHRVAEGAPTFSFVGFPDDRTKAYVTSNHETDTDALYLYDIPTDSFIERLFHSEASDVYSVIQARADGKAIGVTYAEEDGDIHWFGESFVRDIFGRLEKSFPDKTITVTSINPTDTHAVLFMSEATSPGRYYLFDINARQIAPLPEQYPVLSSHDMGDMVVTSYKARDGLDIPAFITLPPGIESLEDAKNLPFVINPHGGPSARVFAGFDWETQFLASRGYAVLQMNFRGSTGYGEAFRAAGDRQWGQAMQDDITDGTKWLIDNGYADPNRIAIMGASYGGYAALMGLVKTPDTYQCAVVHGAVTDLPAILRDADKYTGGRYRTRHIGRLWGDRDMLRDNSPALQAERISAPVLMFHGEQDRVVDVNQARTMERALRRANKDVNYVELPDGTHYLNVRNNRITYIKETESFLKSCIG